MTDRLRGAAQTLVREFISELDKRAVELHAYGHIAQCHICGGLGEEYQHTHKEGCLLLRGAVFVHGAALAAPPAVQGWHTPHCDAFVDFEQTCTCGYRTEWKAAPPVGPRDEEMCDCGHSRADHERHIAHTFRPAIDRRFLFSAPVVEPSDQEIRDILAAWMGRCVDTQQAIEGLRSLFSAGATPEDTK